MKVFIDIETIPGQKAELKKEIAVQFPEIMPPEEPKRPRNIKKAETIKEWETNTLPGLRETAQQKHQEEVARRETAIEEAWRKTGLYGDQGEVICIGWAIEDTEPMVLSRNLGGSETELIQAFFNTLYQRLNKRIPHWVGHNVMFDLRFLFHRAVVLGIKPCINLSLDAKPWSEQVQDTMVMWAGLRDKISLDRICKALGIQSKGDDLEEGEYIDGSLVWDFVKRGEISKVATYCKADVTRCREVYKRINFIDCIAFDARFLEA
jgi:predicted PolB exonuclease-like 3'-5' exonuclease